MDIPSIKIYENTSSNILDEVIYGIEEEGIPYECERRDIDNVIDKSYEASLSSRLSVGISIDSKAIAVHYAHMPAKEPLFYQEFSAVSIKDIRKYGANAARLVKGVPFSL